MWSWFGGAAAQKRKDAPKNAILQLREQLDMLQKRERHLETQISEQEAMARKNVNSDKNAAKNALRRKKVHEKNLEQTTAQIMQLEQQIYSIEAANINHETLAAMKQAGAAMKQIHGGMKLEDVDKTIHTDNSQEELQDQHALSAEIGSVITSFPIGEQPDEEELDAELEGLEQEAMDAKMLHTGTVPVGSQLDRLPAAGNTDLKQPAKAQEEDDEEAELAKLRAEMAM
ncbi:Snf7 [Penicillium mononematosum]|uniref:Snf7 n=1 Tax=Penicillium mononematosum TaxID=268346 RepID=UPI002548ABA2|nr:Snf7 [Penicillium mononematosum]KAJ6187067.1 Snf7 [Penicillium mononematosum]